jgi:hypothetical protein
MHKVYAANISAPFKQTFNLNSAGSILALLDPIRPTNLNFDRLVRSSLTENQVSFGYDFKIACHLLTHS